MGAVSRWLVPAIGLGILLNPLNSSMISVAVPRLEDAFHLTFAEVSWAIVVFYLVSAVAQPVMGRISDVIGRKRLFLTGLVTSLAGSLAAAFATEFAWLLVFRGLQAFGTSMVASVGLSIVRLSITEGRARAVALVSVFLTGAAAFGPAFGGFLLHWTSWQSIFWINIPFVAASFLLAVWAIPGDAAPVTAAKTVDSSIRRFFATPALLRVNAQFILVNLVYYTFFFGFPTYLERLRHLDTLAVGLLMLVLGVAALVGSAVAGRWIDKAGQRPVLLTAGVMMAVGAAPLALLGGDSSVVLIAVILAVMGLAGGLFNVGLQVALFKAAPAEISGLASGLFLTSRYGGTILSSLVLDLAFPQGPTAGGLMFLAVVLVVAAVAFLGLELTSRLLASGEHSRQS